MVVRYADASGVHCSSAGCFAPDGADASVLERWRARHGEVTGCYDVPRVTLQALMARAEARSGRPAPDLTQCFRLVGADARTREDFAVFASDAQGVVDSYVEAIPVPQQDPDTPDFSDRQWYLDTFEESEGMGYRAVWETYGALGAGVKVLDIEAAFNVNHEDLTTARYADLWPGAGTSLINDDDHATAALGLIVAQHNGYGMDGLAPAAEPMFAGIVTREYAWGVGPAIVRQLQTLGPGDMLFLIVSVPGPRSMGNGNQGNLPMESQRAEYDAIRLAHDLGVIVLNAGANGSENLDDEIYGGMFDREQRDSGSIYVCGGIPPGRDNPARSPIWFTNRGSRCDVQAYASNLPTPGYGALFGEDDHNRRYTGSFGGTSGATPLVAGLAALLQSIALARGKILDPDGMRRLLTDTGHPQPEGAHIGPLPDGPAAAALIDAYAVDAPEAPVGPPTEGLRCTGTCAEGLTCVDAVSGEGYCLRVCDPFENTGCPEGRVCGLQVTGDGACIDPGGAEPGAACATQGDCAANGFCRDGVCNAVCSVRAQRGCADGEACLPIGFGIDWGSCGAPPGGDPSPILWPVGDRRLEEGQRLEIALEATDLGGDTLTYTATGLPRGSTFDAATATFVWEPQLGQQGLYTVAFRVRDPAGQTTGENVRFLVIPGPLTARIDAPSQDSWLADARPAVSGATHPGARVEVRELRDGTERVLCEAGATDAGAFLCVARSDLEDGPTELVAVPYDGFGREGAPSESVRVRVDTVAPAVPLLTRPQATNQLPVRFEGAAEAGVFRVFVFDSESNVVCAGDAEDRDDGTTTWACTAAEDHSEGEHTVVLRARDRAGNRSEDSSLIPFSVDLTAPPAPTIEAPEPQDTVPRGEPVVVSGEAEGGPGSVHVQAADVSCTAPLDEGGWSCELPGFSDGGSQEITATTTDVAGNASPTTTVQVRVRVPAAEVVGVEVAVEPGERRPSVRVQTAGADAASVTLDAAVLCEVSEGVAEFSCAPEQDLAYGEHEVRVVASVENGEPSEPVVATFEIVELPAPASGKGGGCQTGSRGPVHRLWLRR